MKIACIGGGPAGLYLGILIKRSAPEHEVVIYERNRPADTFGFGVVFSDATLGNLAAADPQTHAEITSRFARWDDIEIHFGGEVLRSTGHGFCGIERKSLLQILQTRALELGVRIEFEHDIRSVADVTADVIVACDGVASSVRDALPGAIGPHVDVRPNRFVWLGTTVPYKAFTFLFKQTPRGMFRVHAYRYAEASSTFIVECTPETWRAFGFDTADEDRTIAVLSEVFADELAGHPLIKNRSIWRNFPTVRCTKWHAGNVVLVGDAAHTAHFSIGSGTKLAMEDVIVLRDELLATHDVTAALAAYEARRRPEVEALQAAAQASLEWFEGTERYMQMSPMQFTYSLMTRSLRVSHRSVAKRDPHLASGVETELSVAAGVPQTKPTALPFQLGMRRARSRLAIAAHFPPATVPALAPAAAIAIPPWITTIASPEAAENWRQAVEAVHAAGGLIAARVHMSKHTASNPTGVASTVVRADFDLVILDGGDALSEQFPARVAELQHHLQDHCWIGVVVHDHPAMRAAVMGHAAQLVRAGAKLIWVKAEADGSARLPAAPLADRIRNELGVATMIDGGTAMAADLDAAIAAGRTDLVAVSAIPPGLS